MLNWDDPLAKPTAQPVPAEAEPAKPDHRVAEAAAEYNHLLDDTPVEAPQQDSAIGDPVITADVKPVNAEDKRVINGMTDINQLAPFKYLQRMK